MAGSISSYDSGSALAADVLGGVFKEQDNLYNSYVKYDAVKKRFDSNGPTVPIGNIGSTSFSARFKLFDREAAQSNRATYQAIQNKLATAQGDKKYADIANAFGWNFALSKMMGRPITDGAVVSFLDQQVSKQKEQPQKAQEGKTNFTESKKTSILERLFGKWSSSASGKQVRTKVTTAGAARNKLPKGAEKTRAVTTTVNKSKQVAAKTTTELKASFLSLSDRIRKSGGQPYRDFEVCKNTKSNSFSEDEKQIVETLDKHAQKNPAFLKKLNHCFSGESSEDIEVPWGETGWISSVAKELQGLYEEAQKGKSIFS